MPRWKPLKERFEEKTMPEPNSGCLLWLGYLAQGRAQFSFEGRMRTAARVSWMLYRGSTLGLHVLHKCDNPACVNPAHLYLGMDKENAADRSKKYGKLTPDKVREARALVSQGHTCVAVAKLFGVGPNALRRAVIGRTWTQVV
jgi:hypothetical protein